MAISLGELATRFGCDLSGDPDIAVERVASLGDAGANELTFLSNSKLIDRLAATQAAAVVLRAEHADACPVATLIADDPYATYARMAAVIHPPVKLQSGVHSTAVIAPAAEVGETAQIDALAYIGERSIVGESVYIGPGTVIGPDCVIGDGCRFIANVTLARQVTIGKRGLFHPGSVIGADGFGNVMMPEGWVKVPQIGGVKIGNDVEVGANTTIDCGTIGDTVIEDGVRLDNLCMIGHNARIGAHTAMASGAAIAGSVTIGKRCLIAGKAGTVGHISICDDVQIGGRATVTKDITEPGTYAGGFAAEKAGDWNRRVARFKRIQSLYDRIAELEKGDE